MLPIPVEQADAFMLFLQQKDGLSLPFQAALPHHSQSFLGDRNTVHGQLVAPTEPTMHRHAKGRE